MADDRIVWRQRHAFPAEQRYQNPLFPRKEPPTGFKKRGVIIVFVVLALCLAGFLYAAFWSTTFAVTYTTFEGTHFLQPNQLSSVSTAYENEKTLFVFPHNRILFYSTHGAEQYIKKTLSTTQAVESVTVRKHFPNLVTIIIKERIPNAAYSNGGKDFLLDRGGVVVSALDEKKKIDPSFPKLIDQTTRDIAPGQAVVHPDLVNFLFSVQAELQSHSDVTVDTFYIPPVTCTVLVEPKNLDLDTPASLQPLNTNTSDSININGKIYTLDTNAIVPEEKPKVNLDVNTNTTSNRNTSSLNKNINQAGESNTNSGTSNVNDTNSTNTSAEPCSLNDKVIKDLAVRAKTKDKWEIYLRVDDSPETQIARLVTLLKQKNPDRSKLQYVDLRFGDQVIYK